MLAADLAVKHIYVIEDDISASSLIREALELEGEETWTISVYNNGAAAVKAIQAQIPDLVLLDLRLPDTDGGTIFRLLRGNPISLHKPIVFISGATSHELHDSGIDEGVLLRKPVNLGILLNVVRSHLNAA